MVPERFQNTAFQYKVMHFNIQGLNSKFEELKLFLIKLADINVELDVILLCETFINDNNATFFNLPGYNFILKKQETYA
jgi:exonuclease III